MRWLPLLLCVLPGCAAPIAGLWPPEPGARTHRIVVSTDPWHSVVSVWPEDDPAGLDADGVREWGYADHDYYLAGDNGVGGCCGALCWPTDAVIRVGRAGQSHPGVAARSVQRWTFQLSEPGYRRLVLFLQAERDEGVISTLGGSEWHRAQSSYHVFHHCNHFTARALRAAGLPIWSLYATCKWSFELQLDRAVAWTKG